MIVIRRLNLKHKPHFGATAVEAFNGERLAVLGGTLERQPGGLGDGHGGLERLLDQLAHLIVSLADQVVIPKDIIVQDVEVNLDRHSSLKLLEAKVDGKDECFPPEGVEFVVLDHRLVRLLLWIRKAYIQCAVSVTQAHEGVHFGHVLPFLHAHNQFSSTSVSGAPAIDHNPDSPQQLAGLSPLHLSVDFPHLGTLVSNSLQSCLVKSKQSAPCVCHCRSLSKWRARSEAALPEEGVGRLV
mmetsp:Transcript_19922/g.50437  ORF Transcript_19922/g.50437 Transcript_19922/m.50437 type:complete len:241 (+) Transcript_19922:1237-1959(+)